MKSKPYSHFVGLIIAFLISGCLEDAPRINPLDPDGENNRIEITGSVERIYSDAAITGAQLMLMPQQITAVSDNSGRYSITMPPESVLQSLICSAPGFQPDTVTLSTDRDTELNFRLNALPEFQSIALTTLRQASFIPGDQFFLDLNVMIEDDDGQGDVSLVWFEVPATGAIDTLTRLRPEDPEFFIRIRPSVIGFSHPEAMIGQPFVFHAEDAPGSKIDSGPRFITRVIREVPEADILNQPQTLPITFRWQPLQNPGFPYSFTIEIYLDSPIQFPPIIVLEDIPSTETSWLFSGPLASNDYFWVIYIVDEFGNRSRSLPRELMVQ